MPLKCSNSLVLGSGIPIFQVIQLFGFDTSKSRLPDHLGKGPNKLHLEKVYSKQDSWLQLWALFLWESTINRKKY